MEFILTFYLIALVRDGGRGLFETHPWLIRVNR